MQIRIPARLALGTALLAAGFAVLAGGPIAQGAIGMFDMKDRQCRHAPVAVGAACPSGCSARPIVSAEARSAPPECHSQTWMATCGKACEARDGYVRLPDGRLVEDDRLVLTLRAEPDGRLRDALSEMRVALEPRFDGLDRYDARAAEGGKIEKIKKRLSALPQVASVDYVLR